MIRWFPFVSFIRDGTRNVDKVFFVSSLIKTCFLFLLLLFLFACTTSKRLSKKDRKWFDNQIVYATVFASNFTGFELYNPQQQAVIYEHNSDKLFTPASNTKILTLYSALSILEDSIPALCYYPIGQDSLLFWGTGDPTLLHPRFLDSAKVVDFLKQPQQQLLYSSANFMDARYGTGWAWDDYPYYYQVEQAAMPIYGNVITIKKELEKEEKAPFIPPLFDKQEDTIFIDSLKKIVEFKTPVEGKPIVLADFLDVNKSSFYKEIPFKYSDTLLVQLLEQELDKEIAIFEDSLPIDYYTLYSLPVDSVLIPMMDRSDNFLAEQLLLLCSHQLFDTLNRKRVIQYAKDSLFNTFPLPIRWVDGSGLSRYNLISPQFLTRLLNQLYHRYPFEQLKTYFPVINGDGMLKNTAGVPFVFAKTGSMGNVYCLSGYLLTKSNKVMIFSFMHNHFMGGSVPIKKKMYEVLRRLHYRY